MKIKKVKRKKVAEKYYTEIAQEIDEMFHSEPIEVKIKDCSKACIENDVECDFKKCEHWINFGEDHNCDLVSIQKHGQMTLRQVGERIGVSYVRIKQIEDAAIKKIRNTLKRPK